MPAHAHAHARTRTHTHTPSTARIPALVQALQREALHNLGAFLGCDIPLSALRDGNAPGQWQRFNGVVAPALRPDDVRGSGHHRLRAWQFNQPLFDGRGRWRRELTAQEVELVRRIAGPTLIEAGYATDDGW